MSASHFDDRVLERNLELLMTRAYVPVRPAPEFRASLQLAVTRALVAQGRRPRTASVARRTGLLRVAAAALLVAGAGWIAWSLLHQAAHERTRAEILAAGEDALRRDAPHASSPAPWRAFDASEEANGVELAGGALELATATRPAAHADAAAKVWLAAEGSAAFAGDSDARIELAAAEHAVTLVLERGALVLERLASGGTWRVATSQGSFALERGVLDVAYVGPELADGKRSVRAYLESGVAWLEPGSGGQPRAALSLAVPLVIRGGEIVTAASSLPFDAPDARTSIASASAEAAGTTATSPTSIDALPAAASASLQAELVLPRERVSTAPDGKSETRELPGAWTATVIEARRLPEVGQAVTRRFGKDERGFTWTGLRPGNYEVFVAVPGLGTWRTADLLLGAGEKVAIVVRLDPPARIAGRVLDAATGAPIADAQVLSETDAPAAVLPFLMEGDTPEGWKGWSCLATTGPDGSFALEALSAGRHVLRACAPGRGAEWTSPLAIDAGSEHPDVVFRLSPGGSVGGHLADAEGRPRPGVVMLASRVDFGAPRRCISFGYALTGADGGFEIGGLASGFYVLLEIAGQQPGPNVVQVSVVAPEYLHVELPGPARGAVLTGRAKYADGTAVPDVDVSVQPAQHDLAESKARSTADADSAQWKNERTDKDGRFTFSGLKPGRYSVFAGRRVGSQFTLVEEVDVPDVNRVEHDVVLPRALLQGRVTRTPAEAGEPATPLPQATVILLFDQGGEETFGGLVQTEPDGSFSSEFLRPGRWRAFAYANGEGLAPGVSEWLELRPGGAERRHVEIVLAPGARATIRVTGAGHDAKPLAGATLEFRTETGERVQLEREDLTGKDGTFRVRGIAPGTWIVRARREGFLPAEARITLELGDDRELDLALEPVPAGK